MNSHTHRQGIAALSICIFLMIFALIPMVSSAETTESSPSQNNSSDIVQPKDTKKDNDKAEAARTYIQRGKNLTINRIWNRATDFSKVQYSISSEKKGDTDPVWKELPGKYVKEDVKKVTIPGTDSLPDGTYTLLLRGIDSKGRAGDPKKRIFTVDGKKPSLSAVTVQDEKGKKRHVHRVRWNADDENFRNVTITVDGRQVFETENAEDDSYDLPNDVFGGGAEHQITVTATDRAGNSVSVNRDYGYYGPIIENVTIEPASSLDHPSPYGTPTIYFNVRGYRIEDVFLDLGSTPLDAWNIGGYKEYTLPVGTLTQPGAYTFYIFAIDGFGYESYEQATYYYDAELPVIEDVSITPETASGSPSLNRCPVISWSVQDRELRAVQYKVGSGNWTDMGTTLIGNYQLPPGTLSHGDNTIRVRAMDINENASSVSTLHYYFNAHPARSDYTVTDLSAREYYGKAVLSWETSAQSDEVKVSVHRGTSAGFTPSSSTLVGEDIDTTTWIDPAFLTGTVYYKVVTEDLTGSWTNDPLISSAVQYTSPLSSGCFTNRTGRRDYLPYYEFNAPMGGGAIEESSGNLLYSQEDFNLTNDHFSYGLTRTYNSKDVRSGMLGKGWSDSYHKELYTSGNDIWFIDTDGSCYLFEETNGSYSCAETKEYTLTEAENGYTLEDKEHIVTTFNASGQMTEQREPNGCSLTFIYGLNGTLTGVISNTGLTEARVLALTYDITDPHLLSGIELFDESQMIYTINSGTLTKVRHKKGNDHIDWNVAYDGSGNVTSLTDGEGNAYSFAWSSGKVSTLTYPDQESAQFTYGSGTASVTGKTPQNAALYTMSATFDTSTGKVLTETGKDGQTTTYTYDTSHPYLVGSETRTVYYQTLSGNTVSFQNREVEEILYTYDSNENIISEVSSDGEVTEYTYDNLDRLTEETTKIGEPVIENVEYTYCEDSDPEDDVTEVYNVETETETVTDEETEYLYDGRGNEKKATTTGNGEVSTVQTSYDCQGDPEEETAISGSGNETVTQQTSSVHDAMGRVICTTDGSTTVETEYDFMGREVRVEETTTGITGSLVTTKTYTDNGSLASVTDPRGLTTTYTYDSMNRCIREHQSGTGITAQDRYTEYGYAQNISTTDGRSQKSYSVCSKETVKDTAEDTVSVTYLDGTGTVIKEVAGTQFTDYSYDGSGNQYAVYEGNTTDGTHYLSLQLIDDKGRSIAQIQNPSVSGNNYSAGSGSLKTKTTYNAQGEIASETDEDGIVTTFTYDSQQRITGVTAGSGNQSMTRSISYSEDENGGSSTEITDPGGKVTLEEVNTAGLTAGMYDIGESSLGTPRQIAVTYDYDAKGRVSQENHGWCRAVYSYDAKDRVTEKKWYSGNTLKKRILYTYTLYGDLASAACYEGNALLSQVSYIYDILGRRTSETTTYSDNSTQTVQYSYDVEGNLSQLTYPNAAQGVSALSYSYDTWGKLTGISNGNDVLREVTYDNFGRRASVTDRLSASADVITSFTYDSLGRILTSTAMKGNTQVEKLTYTYSGSRISQRREESAFPNTAALDETRQYTYDDLGRLVSSTIGTDTTAYSYDSAGNRTGEITSDYEKEYVYNSLNQIESEYGCDLNTYEEQERLFAYDSKGNMLIMYDPETEEEYDYTWTADDLLDNVHYEDGNPEGINETLASMKYDYEGKRIQKDSSKYVYANGKAVVASSYYHNAAYIYAGDETVGAYHGSTWYDYFTDRQGSTMGILKQDGTTAAAYTYGDFGETEARYGNTFQNEVCYTGSIYDWETGEYYLNARYYDPASANFLSQDTYRGDTGEYMQWNLYMYCANDPVNCTDFNGNSISKKGKYERKKVMYQVEFKQLWPIAEAYEDGSKSFNLDEVVVAGGMVVSSFVWPKTIAIAGIAYSIMDTHRVSKGEKWHNKCFDFYDAHYEEPNPPNPYLIEYMKRKKGDDDHKIPNGKWTMYDLKVQKKKPAGFKKAKKKKQK